MEQYSYSQYTSRPNIYPQQSFMEIPRWNNFQKQKYSNFVHTREILIDHLINILFFGFILYEYQNSIELTTFVNSTVIGGNEIFILSATGMRIWRIFGLKNNTR